MRSFTYTGPRGALHVRALHRKIPGVRKIRFLHRDARENPPDSPGSLDDVDGARVGVRTASTIRVIVATLRVARIDYEFWHAQKIFFRYTANANVAREDWRIINKSRELSLNSR